MVPSHPPKEQNGMRQDTSVMPGNIPPTASIVPEYSGGSRQSLFPGQRRVEGQSGVSPAIPAIQRDHKAEAEMTNTLFARDISVQIR